MGAGRFPPSLRPPRYRHLPRIDPTTQVREARDAETIPAGPERSVALAAVSYRSHAHGTGFVFGIARRHARHALRSTAGIVGRWGRHRALHRGLAFYAAGPLSRP